MKKVVLTTALFLGVTSLVQPISPVITVEASPVKKFKDVKDGHWAKSDIEALVGTGAIGGYSDGTFKPSSTITRAQFSKILSILMEGRI